MQIKCLVVAETLNPYTSKTRGPQVDLVVSLLDQCPSRVRLKQTFDLVIPDAEAAPFNGKLLDHSVEVGLTEGEFYGGRLRFRGRIVSIDGKPVGAPTK